MTHHSAYDHIRPAMFSQHTAARLMAMNIHETKPMARRRRKTTAAVYLVSAAVVVTFLTLIGAVMEPPPV